MSEIEFDVVTEIPKISREHGTRKSKYHDLLENLVAEPGKVARLVVDAPGKASARATSLKTAADTLEGVDSDHFQIATRTIGEGSFGVFVVYDPSTPSAEDEYEDE